MQIRGVIRTAELQEHPAGSDRVEIVLNVQGVGAGQPRRLVIPFEYLLKEQGIEPDVLTGRGFQAEIAQDLDARWIVEELALGSRVLRHEA